MASQALGVVDALITELPALDRQLLGLLSVSAGLATSEISVFLFRVLLLPIELKTRKRMSEATKTMEGIGFAQNFISSLPFARWIENMFLSLFAQTRNLILRLE